MFLCTCKGKLRCVEVCDPMSEYGDLEKYLGRKYADELQNSYLSYGLMAEECPEALENSLAVLAMRSRSLLVKQDVRFAAC